MENLQKPYKAVTINPNFMKKYILLFEDFRNKEDDVIEINWWANPEEMKEIEKVKKYYKWWYSNPFVISKLNLKSESEKKAASNLIIDFINKKLISTEFVIFRSKKDETKYWKFYGDTNKSSSNAFGWVIEPKLPIYIRMYLISENISTGESFFETVLHEMAHLIQEFAGEKYSDLHNSTAPKGSYGTDSIKAGLFLPPLDPKGFDKPYENQEIEQFARFHTMRYYFGIKPNDNCNQIYQKVKTAIDEKKLLNKDGASFMRIITIYGKHYLVISKWRGDFNADLWWYFEAYKKPTKKEQIFKKYYDNSNIMASPHSYKEFIDLYEYFIELDVICDDHKNIVSNFDIKETSFA